MMDWLWRTAALGILIAAILCGCRSDSELDPNVDHDKDGWSSADGDLDDTDPLVNPGAYEILNNGVDDDCDPSTSDTVDTDCSTAAVFSTVTPLQLAAAIGLCQTTTTDAPLAERKWGLVSAEFRNSRRHPRFGHPTVEHLQLSDRCPH